MDTENHHPVSSDSEKPDYSDRENGSQMDSEKDDVRESPPSQAVSQTGPLPTEAPPAAPGPGSDIPDGGLTAWLQVLGSWVTLVLTWGLVNTFGVYQTYYETNLLRSSSSSSISWIGSIQASLLMLVGVVAGPLYDAGYFRHLLLSGTFLVVFGQFMTSLGTSYYQILLAQGVCIGAGMGLVFLPSTAILAQYFSSRRAFAIGVASSGSPLAGIVFPIVFSRLLPAVGFGWATRVIAFVLLGLSAVPVAFMRTRVPPTTGRGAGRGTGGGVDQGTGTGAKKRSRLFDAEALRDVPFVLFVLGSFMMFLTLYTAFFYVQLYDELHALSSLEFAPYTVTLLNVGSFFGRLLPNYLADRAGSLNVVIGCGAASAALVFGWMGIRDLAGLVAFALLYGLFSGGIVSVTPSVIMAMAPDMGRVGARMGMTFTLTGVSVLVGTPIAGAILGGLSESEWLGVIGYSAAGLTVGSAFYLSSRIVLYKEKGGLVA